LSKNESPIHRIMSLFKYTISNNYYAFIIKQRYFKN
jgi:hypothetical protein